MAKGKVTVRYVEGLRSEGERGLEDLCMLARKLGYRGVGDQLALGNGAYVSDLLQMLEDNPAMIEAIYEHVLTEEDTYGLVDEDDSEEGEDSDDDEDDDGDDDE